MSRVPKNDKAVRERIRILQDKQRAGGRRARAGLKTASRSPQRKADNAEIADYLARNPPKVW